MGAQIFLGDKYECTTLATTDLTFQRHVVDLRVQQHGAGTKWHRLICDGPCCPAVNPQDLLFTGDYQFFLEDRNHMSQSYHGQIYPRPTVPDARPLLTRSMLCCRRSFPLTASCCLNSSFRGSAKEGGGAIYSHKG